MNLTNFLISMQSNKKMFVLLNDVLYNIYDKISVSRSGGRVS